MNDILKGKKILIVDDERDVCEQVVDELDKCSVDMALTYEEARELLKKKYDVVILDIMGVQGHDLLKEFGLSVPCIMLTAHALTPEHLKKSIKGKAVLYLPKDEMGRLEEYLRKVLETKESLWSWLFKKIDFSKYFGKGWLTPDFFEGIEFEITEDEIMKDLSEMQRQ